MDESDPNTPASASTRALVSSDAPRTRRGRETRAALIDAARERFMADGFLNVGVPAIASTANRSAASFYTYFDSKEDLLRQLAEQAIAQLNGRIEAELSADRDPATLIQRVSQAIWDIYREQLPVLLAMFQQAARNLELQPWTRLRAVLTDAIAEVDRRAMLGGATPPPNRAGTARALASMFENTCFVWLSAPVADAPGDDTAAVATLTAIWTATLHGEVQPA